MEKVPSKHGVYFLELSLENVRCFGEKVTIDLRDPKDPTKPARWTVLIGENGVGKTTVLRSLACIAPIPTLPDSTIEKEPGHFQRWGSKWKLNDRQNQEGKINAKIQADSGRIKNILVVSDRDNSGYEGGIELESLVVLAYGASRHMGTRGIEEDPLKNASLSLFQDNAELTNASELFHQTYITAQKKGDSRLHDTLKSIILSVLPGITDIRTAEGSGFSWRAEVLTPYGWVWIHDLSLGYKTMVAWIVDFASKLFLLYRDSPNPLAEPAVCLVDEIDLHMHPTWQRKIMGFLTDKFPNTQFIVTAHSPLMVQAAAEANIVLLKREGDHVVVENDPIVVKNWSVDQILVSMFGVSARPEDTEEKAAKRRDLRTRSFRTAEEDDELLELSRDLEGYSIYKSEDEQQAASLMDEFVRIIQERKAGNHDQG
jgi:AAA15 family ATPase/GTPase